MLKNKIKGQSTTELAILGSVILLILGAMLRYAQTITASQQMQIYAFNRALQFAQGRSQADKMGRVSFNAVQDIYPVDVTGFRVQGTNVSGSATVLYDPEMTFYEGKDKEDYGKTYTQTGRDMIAKNEVIEFPQIKVTRKNDSKGKSAWWEMIADTLFGSDSEEDVEVWEAAPVERTEQVTGPQGMDLEKDWGGVSYVQELYEYPPMDTTNITRRENVSGVGGTKISQRREQNLQNYYFKSESEIKEDDPDVVAVSENPSGNLKIISEKTITKEKQWQTPQ